MARFKNVTRRKEKPIPRAVGEKTVKDGKVPKKKPTKPGARALKEIRQLQKSFNLLIPKMSMSRLIRQITQEFSCTFRWSAPGLAALHHAAEDFVIGVLEDAYLCAFHAKRVTLMDRDIRLAMRLRRDK